MNHSLARTSHHLLLRRAIAAHLRGLLPAPSSTHRKCACVGLRSEVREDACSHPPRDEVGEKFGLGAQVPSYLLVIIICLGAAACSDDAPPAIQYQHDDLGVAPVDSTISMEAGSLITMLSLRQLDKMPTLVEIKWETSRPTLGQVRFGLTKAHTRKTPQSPTASQKHRALLKGLPASSDVWLEVVATPVDGSATVTIERKTRTGPLPAGLPVLTLSKYDKARASGGYTLLPINGVGGSWLAMVDGQGRYVWWTPIQDKIMSAHISRDRSAVLLLQEGQSATSGGGILHIPLDGSATTLISAPGAHTDFVEFEPGKYAVLGWEVRQVANGTRKLLGDTIIEASKGAAAKVVWRVFDHFKPDLSVTYHKGWYQADPTVEDWSHVNGISYDAQQKSYFVTASGGLDLAMKITRASGKVVWSLGEQGDVDRGGDLTLVVGPHSVQSLTDTILVFNRGRLSLGECSNATELAVDEGSKKATRKWSYKSSACYQVYFLGDADRLWNGNTLVNWSTAGHIEEVTAKGDVVWSLRAALGAGFGFIQRVRSLQ